MAEKGDMKVYLFTILIDISNAGAYIVGSIFEKFGQTRTHLKTVIPEIKANSLNMLDVKNTLLVGRCVTWSMRCIA